MRSKRLGGLKVKDGWREENETLAWKEINERKDYKKQNAGRNEKGRQKHEDIGNI